MKLQQEEWANFGILTLSMPQYVYVCSKHVVTVKSNIQMSVLYIIFPDADYVLPPVGVVLSVI